MTVTLSLMRESGVSTCDAETTTDSLTAASASLNVEIERTSCATSIVLRRRAQTRRDDR